MKNYKWLISFIIATVLLFASQVFGASGDLVVEGRVADTVNIGTALLPDIAGGADIGTEVLYFETGYFGTSISFEGATDNDFQLTLTVTDPTTPDKTITFPDLTGTVGLSANNLGFFASTTSAQLFGVLSNETGSSAGALSVFSISPTITTALTVQGLTGAVSTINIISDAAEDNPDSWKIEAADSGDLTVESFTSGSWVAKTTLTNAGIFTAAGGFDAGSSKLTSLANPTVSTDAVNLKTLLDNVDLSLHYWFGNATLDLLLTDSEDVLLETPDADPKTLTTITFKSSVADTATPFLISAGAIISIHYAADVTSVSGKHDEQLKFQLGYVDSDGTTGFSQIGSDSDLSAVLTATKTYYAAHVHVSTDTTVPSGKRLWLKVIADATLGGSSYPEINFYFDAVEHHLNFGIGGEILDNFVLKSGDTMTGVLTVQPDGTNEVFQVNDGTLDFTDGNAGTTGTLTIDLSGNLSYNKNFAVLDGKNLLIGEEATSYQGATSGFRVATNVDARRVAVFTHYRADDTMGFILALAKSQSDTQGTLAYPGADSILGQLVFAGADEDGARFEPGAEIRGVATELWDATGAGTKIELYTTDNGTLTNDLRLTIDQDGTFVSTPDGTNNVFTIADGSLTVADGNGGTVGTLTIDSDGDIAHDKNISAATYASDSSVTDAELKFINTVTSNVQDQLAARAPLTITDVDFLPIGYCKDGGTAPEAIATVSSTNDVEARNFDDAQDEDVFCTWQVPKDFTGASVTFQVVLVVTNATAPAAAEGVSFFGKGNSLGTGDGLATALDGTIDSSEDDLNDAGATAQYDIAYTPYSAAMTITNLAVGELAILNFYRDISDADDDYLQDIGVIGFNIKYSRTLAND